MIKTTLGPGITVYNIKDEIGENVIDLIENSIGDLFYTSHITDEFSDRLGIVSDQRKCSEYLLSEDILNEENSLKKDLFLSIKNNTDLCLEDYRKDFQIEPVISNSWIILKYSKNDKFDWHVDSGRRYSRNVSATLYFNDNYEGGLIEYKHFNISYKPKAGDLILFGSDFPYMHRVTPIINGTRYAAVNWYRYSTRPLEYFYV